jgi:cell division protein YceG involved in septum cleavage
MKASDEHNIEGWMESETHDFDKNKTQQKLLLQKVEEFE